MKKIMIGMIAISAITFSAEAQVRRDNTDKSQQSTRNRNMGDGTARNHHKMDHKLMAEKLHLSDAQKQQMKSINMDFKNRIKEVKNSGSLSEAEKKTQMSALKQEKKQKTQELLTPEQRDQMKELKKETRNKKDKASAGQIGKMKSSLGLSAEQMEKMKAERENFHLKREAINNDQSLTMDQKKEKLQQLKSESRNDFKNNLTPEQLKKLEEMKNKRAMKTS